MGIRDHVASTITYTLEDQEEWQTPRETIERGKGDCEDMATLIMHLAYQRGIVSEMAIVYLPTGHYDAMVLYDNMLILATNIAPPAPVESEDVRWIIGYHTTMLYAEIF